VSDTGIGMSAEVREHIFEPFFTTKELGRGTGLGLASCYGIVQQNGGHIWVYSEPGRSTTFTIYLPRVYVAESPAAQQAAVAAALPRGTETILLAEDEETVRDFAALTLRGLGYTVLVADNGAEALRQAAAHEGEIHLLLTDVVMPGAGGRVVAERLAELRPNLKVLYASGYTDDAMVRHGILSEAMNFLQKPFTPAALTHMVREVLDRG
jgi:two-component system cell cycle sensor histidine kinase/response regulator CckA